jgi:hypothetical protein
VKVLVRTLDRFLRSAENHIALLDRTRPSNGPSEQARVLAAWRSGRALEPRFMYPRPADLSALRAELSRIARGLSGESAWGRLYAQRALELESEAGIAEAAGSARIAALASARYAASAEDTDGALARANRFCGDPGASTSPEAVFASDDERSPDSLVSAFRRRARELGLPLRVEARSGLASAAATTMDGHILVCAGRLHTASAVRRIVLHEIEAHALPRRRAASEPCGIFAVGTARGADDEEGRALVLEERAGYLGGPRRVELGMRHHAALAVRQGAAFVETVRVLIGLGAELGMAIELGCRAHRGGGLGREFVYLTAFCRVRRVFEARPELESWLERGRISVESAALMAELGPAPYELELELGAPQPSARNAEIKRFASENGGGMKKPCGARSSSRETQRASSSSS